MVRFRPLLRPGLILVAFLTLIGGIVRVIRSPQGWPSMLENRRKVQEIERSNDELRKQMTEMEQRNERLRHDREAQDEEVRRNTFKQKPGETTVILPHDSKP
ncbi:MAG: septum formation initiator family protein [Bryobacterales bacterium]|nr:septum formation initiator family protein [Bryobacterales bacterium]